MRHAQPTEEPFDPMPRRTAGRRRIVSVIAAVMLAVSLGTAIPGAALHTSRRDAAAPLRPAPTRPEGAEGAGWRARPLVALWGDSLAWESQDAFIAAVTTGTGGAVRARTHGGTAPCDWLDDIEAAVAAEPVAAAVLEFSGNAFTPCMQDPDTGAPVAGDRYLATYAQDLERALAILRSGRGTTRVYLVGAPPNRDELPDGPAAKLRALYRRAARTDPDTVYVPAGDAVLDGGRWTAALPCLAIEGPQHGCVDGHIAVRAADGIHFCPTTARAPAGVVEPCPTWSSGAARFGIAMAEPVRRDLRRSRRTDAA